MTDLGYICDWPHTEVELACECGFHRIETKAFVRGIYGVLCPMEKVAEQLSGCTREDCGVYYPDAEGVVTGFTQPEIEE
jgi:hypothetical protein